MTIQLAHEVYESAYKSIERYVDILTDRGISWGLLGSREADRLWERHILNCAAIADLVPEGAGVIDVGSGAGLPGIPLAVLRPDISMVLLEPLLRRANFLTSVVAELDLGNRVEVVRSRAEDHHARYDIVTSRALAPLDRLIRWSAPLLAPSGMILALKGANAVNEVSSMSEELKKRGLEAEVLSVRAHPLSSDAIVVRVVKTAG